MRASLLLAACVLAGCLGSRVRRCPPVTLSYQPVIKHSPGLPAVAVYLFEDDRPQKFFTETANIHWVQRTHSPPRTSKDPFSLGGVLCSRPHCHSECPLRAETPVALVVGQAFAAGLTARGFAVVDHSTLFFRPDPGADAATALLGSLRDLGLPHAWGGDEVPCAMQVELRDSKTGNLRWQKTYTSTARIVPYENIALMLPLVGGFFDEAALSNTIDAAQAAMNQALAKAIEKAVMDPEFSAALRWGPRSRRE
jgi:hypothetical protein